MAPNNHLNRKNIGPERRGSPGITWTERENWKRRLFTGKQAEADNNHHHHHNRKERDNHRFNPVGLQSNSGGRQQTQVRVQHNWEPYRLNRSQHEKHPHSNHLQQANNLQQCSHAQQQANQNHQSNYYQQSDQNYQSNYQLSDINYQSNYQLSDQNYQSNHQLSDQNYQSNYQLSDLNHQQSNHPQLSDHHQQSNQQDQSLECVAISKTNQPDQLYQQICDLVAILNQIPKARQYPYHIESSCPGYYTREYIMRKQWEVEEGHSSPTGKDTSCQDISDTGISTERSSTGGGLCQEKQTN